MPQKGVGKNLSQLYHKGFKITIFRVDFGSKIGLGHLKRSLVYAKNFDDVIYVSKSNEQALVPYPLKTIKNEEEFFEIVKKLNPKQVIVDNYEFTIEHQKQFKKLFGNIKLSCFDDEYKEYFCDEIINHNLGVKKEKYKNPKIVKIIPPLIRDEFRQTKKKKYKKEGIFISLGGSDSKNLTLKILKLLQNKKINLYITTANQNIKKIKRYAKIHKNIRLYINEDVAYGMAKSECGIITPSVISYEALYMNLPFIAIKTADNQKEIAKYLKKKRIKVFNDKGYKKISRFIP